MALDQSEEIFENPRKNIIPQESELDLRVQPDHGKKRKLNTVKPKTLKNTLKHPTGA
jgi:prolyl-tRNA editing enzyme YbaK/EbsC (Cys-tRNA(Pro) deacylase)